MFSTDPNLYIWDVTEKMTAIFAIAKAAAA